AEEGIDLRGWPRAACCGGACDRQRQAKPVAPRGRLIAIPRKISTNRREVAQAENQRSDAPIRQDACGRKFYLEGLRFRSPSFVGIAVFGKLSRRNLIVVIAVVVVSTV